MLPPLKRHIKWNEVGGQLKTWHPISYDGEHEPDKALTWIEENLSGEWTFRSLRDAEIREQFGREPGGRFYTMFAFAELSDFQKFRLNFGEVEGQS